MLAVARSVVVKVTRASPTGNMVLVSMPVAARAVTSVTIVVVIVIAIFLALITILSILQNLCFIRVRTSTQGARSVEVVTGMAFPDQGEISICTNQTEVVCVFVEDARILTHPVHGPQNCQDIVHGMLTSLSMCAKERSIVIDERERVPKFCP